MRRNEEDFQQQATELLHVEAKIRSAMETVQYIESSSKAIKETYMANTHMMRAINGDQDDILGTLAGIEKELDLLLSEGGERQAPSFSQGKLVDFYNDPITSLKALEESASPYESRVARQQIFQKAFLIDQYTDDIQAELAVVERQIDATQSIVAREQARKNMLSLEDGTKVSMDDILNQHYEALMAIEGAAEGLKFMTEDVAAKVEAAKERLFLY